MKWKYISGGAATLLGGWTAWSIFSVAFVKQPKYRVLEKREGYELRAYEPYIVAETEVQGGFKEAMRKGFRTLFEYITGSNMQTARIKMTAPVLECDITPPTAAPETKGIAVKTRAVSFIMPPGSSVETLPLPVDAAIKLRQVPPRKVAALRFTMNVSEARLEKKKRELLDSIGKDKLEPAAPAEYAGYNPPTTIPFLRRNEILVEVK